jgi:hypothetical protein
MSRIIELQGARTLSRPCGHPLPLAGEGFGERIGHHELCKAWK